MHPKAQFLCLFEKKENVVEVVWFVHFPETKYYLKYLNSLV